MYYNIIEPSEIVKFNIIMSKNILFENQEIANNIEHLHIQYHMQIFSESLPHIHDTVVNFINTQIDTSYRKDEYFLNSLDSPIFLVTIVRGIINLERIPTPEELGDLIHRAAFLSSTLDGHIFG